MSFRLPSLVEAAQLRRSIEMMDQAPRSITEKGVHQNRAAPQRYVRFTNRMTSPYRHKTP